MRTSTAHSTAAHPARPHVCPNSASSSAANSSRTKPNQSTSTAYSGLSVPGLSRRLSHDNLHIRIEGAFTLAQAGGIVGLLEEHSHEHSHRRIFIDVREVTELTHKAAETLKTSLRRCAHPERTFFKGSHGFSLAADGNKVLILPERDHVCCGKCAVCTCGGKKKTS